MEKIFELNATKSHYHFVMTRGYYINKELNKGTLTLIGTKNSEEKYNNGFSVVSNYKYVCRDCGWDFISKNTYNRAGFKSIQCPNCGYNHLPEGTVIVNSEDMVVPVYYNIVLCMDDGKIVLEMKCRGGEREKRKWDAKETISFDLLNKEVEWNWHNLITGTICTQKIGYLEDNTREISSLACLTMDAQDDEGHSIQELCELLSKEITKKMKQLHQAKAKSLILKCSDRRRCFFDTLLKMAHYTRFCEAPDTKLYGTNKSLTEWYRDNNLYHKSCSGFEYKLEEYIRSMNLSYYEAMLKHFSVPDFPSLRERFSYKNIGLYQVVENRFKSKDLVELLFSYTVKLSSAKSSAYSDSSSMQMIFLRCMEMALKTYPELQIDILKDIVDCSFSFIKNINTTDEYKAYLKNSRKDREWYIVNAFENRLAEEMFSRQIQKQAEIEKKDFYQVLSAQLEIPNTSAIRKYYLFGLIKIYQRIYKEHKNLQIANELVKMAYKVYSNTYYRKIDAVEAYLDFYDAFKEYYPGVITPSYACNYALNPKNNPADCVRMIKSLQETSLMKFKTEKPRMKNLHDYLSLLNNLQKNPETIYDIPEDVKRRTEMYLKNMKLSVLTKYSELYKVGKTLHNCAATYRDSITSNHYLVLATDDKGFPKALLEIKDEAIVQAKLMNNKPVWIKPDVQDIVVKFASKGRYKLETTDVRLNDEPAKEVAS